VRVFGRAYENKTYDMFIISFQLTIISFLG
jgi:hypothetical protein